jgi:hypothetical protein
MTTYEGIDCPCYGTLDEIHKALIGDLHWTEKPITINGFDYIVTEKGFRNNQSEREYLPSVLAEFLHGGTAILIGMEEWDDRDIPLLVFQIFTTGKIPHISKRCALCGFQLNQEDQKYCACGPCRAEESN